jgi:predicted flap endonuclease-1-like 5' DNA nuclease
MTLLDTIKSVLGLDDGRSNDRRNERSESTGSEPTAPATESEDAVKGTGSDGPAAAGGDAAGSTESMLDKDAEGGAEPGEVTGPASGDDAGDDLDTEDEAQTDESAAAAGGDAAGSTGSMTDESGSAGAAEPGEAVGPTGEEDPDPDHGEHGGDDTTSGASDDVSGGDGTAADAAAAGSDAAGSTGSVTEETNESISAAEDAEAAGPTDADPDEDTADHSVDALKGIGPSYAERLGESGIESVADLAEADPGAVADEIDVSESRVERWNERAKARRQ